MREAHLLRLDWPSVRICVLPVTPYESARRHHYRFVREVYPRYLEPSNADDRARPLATRRKREAPCKLDAGPTRIAHGGELKYESAQNRWPA